RMTKPKARTMSNEAGPVVDPDLPLIITPAKGSDPLAPLVFFISGDGGWYSFEGNMSDLMAESGTPTVGLDAKKYFWDRKTPEQSAAAVEQTCKSYMARFNKQKVLLVGYSMGAEVLPFIFSNLSPEMKSAVKGSVLLSPGEMGDFEVHITNMLSMGNSSNTYDVVKELKLIAPSTPVLIITGEKEDSTLPKELEGTGIKFAQVPGDHHYDNDPGSIVRILKAQGLVP
ncbi:MAG: AcvB/VirJ family lysyl-phosphatidylglycerol hydrolase, partial [Flavobacteriales bacterium]